MAANGLHISISAEPVAHIGDIAITNSMLTSLVVSALLITFAVAVRSQLKQTNKPTGLQNLAEWIIESMHSFIYSITGDLKKTRLFFPFITTFFLWIIFNNWIGLLPGVGSIYVIEPEKAVVEVEPVALESIVQAQELEEEEVVHEDVAQAEHEETAAAEEESHGPAKVPLFRAGTADLNTTLALALISVFFTQVFGIKHNSLGYFKKFINFSSPIMFFVGILEIISEFAKVISFTFRLFGNIFAGEVLLAVILALVPVIAPMPFYGLELFVGFIQALVFAMLSLVFFNMASESHEH